MEVKRILYRVRHGYILYGLYDQGQYDISDNTSHYFFSPQSLISFIYMWVLLIGSCFFCPYLFFCRYLLFLYICSYSRTVSITLIYVSLLYFSSHAHFYSVLLLLFSLSLYIFYICPFGDCGSFGSILLRQCFPFTLILLPCFSSLSSPFFCLILFYLLLVFPFTSISSISSIFFLVSILSPSLSFFYLSCFLSPLSFSTCLSCSSCLLVSALSLDPQGNQKELYEYSDVRQYSLTIFEQGFSINTFYFIEGTLGLGKPFEVAWEKFSFCSLNSVVSLLSVIQGFH